ncbi:MAG: hypothetical protein ACXWLR_02775, partial [Myxococcales bacterium]
EAGTVAPARRNQVRALKERYYDLGRRIVGDLFRAGCGAESASGGTANPLELEHMTYGVFGMLNWTYGWYDPPRHGTPGEVARSLQRLALSGLTAEYRHNTDIERRISVVKPLPLLGRRKP